MGNNSIANKNFNPYDLGSVAKVLWEHRGQHKSSTSEPYVPPRPKDSAPAVVGPSGPAGRENGARG
jgi:hypothetical protein